MTNGILALILIAISVVMIIGLTSFFTKEERRDLKSVKKAYEEATQTLTEVIISYKKMKKNYKESKAMLDKIYKEYEKKIREMTDEEE